MMMFIVLLLLACFHGLSAVQWASAYQNTTKICPGDNLTLGWDYSLEPGETVEDIKWLFTSSSNQTPSVIANYASGFFCSDPSYDNRLTHLSDGKVVLASQTLADAGTYVVEVITKQATDFSSIRRNLVVSVADPSTYSINVLTVKMDDQTVPGEDGRFHVRLTCGPLAWRGEPPVDVMWTTPSGAKRNSTGYENDYFYLMLDNSILNGIYACGLPASAIPALCLQAGDPLAKLTTVMVDSTSARRALLEANFQQVQGENIHLTQQLNDLTQQLQEVKGDLTQQLQEVKGDLTHQLQQVRTKQDQCRVDVGNNNRRMKLLEDDFSHYRNISSTHVGFYARLGQDITINVGNPVKFSLILYNYGRAYDSTTGQFTAPVGGTYFFIFTASPARRQGGDSSCQLVVGSDAVAGLWTRFSEYYHYATGHAVVHVEKGTIVWVKSWKDNQLFESWSSFGGFLIRADV